MNWWQMETKEAARRLETDEKQGLTSQMAAERLAQKGRNELAETDGKKSLFWRFLAQFDDFMILLLLGAAVVSVVISRLSGENDVLDAVMILGIVVLNAALGLFQESKAEKALEALKKNGGTSCPCRKGWHCAGNSGGGSSARGFIAVRNRGCCLC